MTDRRLLLLSAAMVLLSSGAGHGKKGSPKADPVRHYELGVQFLNQARPDRAAAELEKAVSLDPSSTMMHYALGLAYMGQRDWKKATRAFQRVLELDPFYTDAHNSLGIVYSEAGDLPRARVEWERCLANPKYHTPEVARFNIGKSLLDQGNAADALPYLKAAVDSKADNAEWQLRYGIALAELERWGESLAALNASLGTRPASPEALFHLGTVSIALKDPGRARETLKRVLELAPGTPLSTRAAELLKGLGS